jgi:hypothetical protein
LRELLLTPVFVLLDVLVSLMLNVFVFVSNAG